MPKKTRADLLEDLEFELTCCAWDKRAALFWKIAAAHYALRNDLLEFYVALEMDELMNPSR
jgi:hypothetical protein